MTTSNEQLDFTHWIYRLIAYIIDSIIIGIPAAIIYFIVILAAIVANPFFFVYGGWLVLPFLFGILQFLYFMILDTAWGATIGKRLMGLQVQMVNGGKVALRQIIHTQHKQNLRAISLLRLAHRSCNRWR